MLKIRLKRIGRKKVPVYRIVVIKSLTSRDSKTVIDLGYYDPIKKYIKLNKSLLFKYINYGAYPTETTRYLLKNIK